MSYTDQFDREWRNAMARATRATKKQYAEKAAQPYTLKVPPEPGSVHDRFVQLLQPVDFIEECLIQHIAHAAIRLDHAVRLRNDALASPAPDQRTVKSVNECYAIARKSLCTQVAHLRSRRPSLKKNVTKRTHHGE